MKLLIYPPVDAQRLEKIRFAAGAMQVANAQTIDEAKKEIVDAAAFYGRLTPEMLAVAEKLCWVQCPTASLEHYLFPQLVEHSCVLTNMRGIYSEVIAEHVFAYILCFARNLHIYIRQQMERKWKPVGAQPQGANYLTGVAVQTPADRCHRDIAGKRLGIVGMGGIGSEIAQRGVSFGMRVVGVDSVAKRPGEGVEAIWSLDHLDDLLSESDFVVVAAPHTPETEGMFDRAQFQRMKPEAFFVNIGRGAIVRLEALTAALTKGEIAGAALDVFETEPLPADHPLWGMENVIITPHVAACAPQMASRHLEIVLDNVQRFALGEPLHNVADKSKWY